MADKRVVDWQELGVTIHRETRKSAIARVHVDVFTFTKPDGYEVKSYVLRKGMVEDKSSSETLAEAISKVADASDVEFVNPPKRVNSAETVWVLSKELWQ